MNKKPVRNNVTKLRYATVNMILLLDPMVNYLDEIESLSANGLWSKQTKFYGNRFRENLLEQMKKQKNMYGEETSKNFFLHVEIINSFTEQLTRLMNIDNHEELEKVTVKLKEIFDSHGCS